MFRVTRLTRLAGTAALPLVAAFPVHGGSSLVSTSRERRPRRQLTAGAARGNTSIPVRWRLRNLALAAFAALCILPAPDADAQLLDDNQLAFTLGALGAEYTEGMLLGLFPFPPTARAGEILAMVSNLQLKTLRPLLLSPQGDDGDFSMFFHPSQDPDDDPCSFHFYLPNSTGNYANLFGLIPLYDTYDDEDTGISYSWEDRWGKLTPPFIGHAQSRARLSVRSSVPVRRYDKDAGEFMQFDVPGTGGVEKTEYYYPIVDAYSPCIEDGMYCDPPRTWGLPQPHQVDSDDQPAVTGGQEVYLPIGSHPMEWTAVTQLSPISDVIVPPVLLLLGVLAEKGAFKFVGPALTKACKATPLVRRLCKGGDPNKYLNFVKALIKGDALKYKLFRKSIIPLLRFLANRVAIIDARTGADLEAQGQVTGEQRKLIDVIYLVASEQGIDRRPAVLADSLDSPEGEPARQSLLEKIVESGLFDKIDTASSSIEMRVNVWDPVPPVWEPSPGIITYEATDIGGMRPSRRIVELRAAAAARVSDNCGRVPEVRGTMPGLFKLNVDNDVTWTAYDEGPNPADGKNYAPTQTQTIRVVDTQPPLLLAPPSKVIEVATGTMELSFPNAEDRAQTIGYALATDVADPDPDITTDAPLVFPVDERLEVRWYAEDESRNEAPPASQLITVKTEGTNTQPVAYGDSVQTLTTEEVDITLIADDIDELGGVYDPLWFKIEKYPEEGQFVAPLLPFFIQDYRTKPSDGLNDHYAKDGNGFPDPDKVIFQDFIDDRIESGESREDALQSYIGRYYCAYDYASDDNFDSGPPRNFVHRPLFVQVTDVGIRYVLDNYFECLDEDGKVSGDHRRISRWSASGEFLGQQPVGSSGGQLPLGNAFVLDRDGFIYYNTIINAGSSQRLDLLKCGTDFKGICEEGSNQYNVCLTDAECPASRCNYTQQPGCQTVASFENGAADGLASAAGFAYARVDSDGKLVYLADDRSIFAFELRENGTSPRYLGELGPKDGDAIIEDWFGTTPALEVGSDGSLYIADGSLASADEQHHRIHKIAPSTIDAAGEFVPGAYVGWSGRCTGGAGCDQLNQRSYGYTCTFDPNSGCSPTLAELETSAGRALASGNGQGQFNSPAYIAIDPYDVLYIADYHNSRVQRLSPGGSFAGEAASTGTGVNKGDKPSFILGNMGMPASVSVNSSQFYVVDQSEKFVHVFGTLPFKDIAQDGATMEATVTYKSENNFPNPNDSGVDDFTFSVTDGLAVSAPATVSVTVSRNFRPPVAFAGFFPTVTEEPLLEDTSLDFELPADDPDGIKGRYFLGREGLDTLTYAVTAEPQHGTLSGSGAVRTYTPNPDYYGEDSLRFKVNDGLDDSDEATVIIKITPVNDVPILTIEVPERVALGFPTLVTSTFTDDDDPSEGYEATAEWGDGQSAQTGEFVFDADGIPRLIDEQGLPGIAVSEPPPMLEGDGGTVAQHVYETLGLHTVETCVTDSGMLTGCDNAEINVEELVSLFIGGRVYAVDPPPEDEIIDDDQSFTYELTIINELRSDGTGLTASDVVLEAALPNLTFSAFEARDGVTGSNRGTCVPIDAGMTCDFGELEPGAEVTVTLSADGPGNLICNEDFAIDATLRTLSDALANEIEMPLSVELVAKVIEPVPDNDSDGLGDPCEDDDDDNDGVLDIDDNCAFVSNPAQVDDNGNGTGDACEDEDHDGVLDDDDNCVFVSNPAQVDDNGNGTGDACEECTTFPNGEVSCAPADPAAPADCAAGPISWTGQHDGGVPLWTLLALMGLVVLRRRRRKRR